MIHQPPAKFVPSTGAEEAHIIKIPQFVQHRKYTGRRLEGIKYERKVHAAFLRLYPEYVPGFWLTFLLNGVWKYCQPDGVHFNFELGIITIIEVKYQHTSNAWWQTTQLYFPVLRLLFPEPLWQFQFCEVVKWYDPSVSFPVPIKLSDSPFKPNDKFKVYIWRP